MALGRSWPSCLFANFLLFLLAATAQGASAAKPLVLFDQGHGQHFVINQQGPLQLSNLAAVFAEQGATVRASTAPLTPKRLQAARALVISGPFKPFSRAEQDAIVNFLFAGGRLALMLHIPMPVNALINRLHLYASNGAIREETGLLKDEARDFLVSDLARHPLTRNLQNFAVYGCWALLNADAQARIIARTSAKAWVDLNRNGQRDAGDPQQVLGVAAVGSLGRGAYVVFGDDAIFQNQFLTNGNAQLARNLAAWLLAPSEASRQSRRRP